jgi:hypothetical protein
MTNTVIVGKSNDLLHTLPAVRAGRGWGGHTETAFEVISNHLALQCKKSGYYRNELAHLSNEEFFANIFN